MQSVLRTPELLDIILTDVGEGGSTHALLNCALVAKQWTWIALGLIWNSVSTGDEIMAHLAIIARQSVSVICS